MSESILNALIHLFALVATVNKTSVSYKGRGVVRTFLRQHLTEDLAEEYLQLFDNYFNFYQKELKEKSNSNSDDESLISFQVSNICRQINKGLHQNERIIVFLRLLEFVNEDEFITPLEEQFISTVTASFRISDEEFSDCRAFIFENDCSNIREERVLVIHSDEQKTLSSEGEAPSKGDLITKDLFHKIQRKNFPGKIIVLQIASTNLFVFRYFGTEALYLEGQLIVPERFYVLEQGGIIRSPLIESIYYNEIVAKFFEEAAGIKVCLTARNIEYNYRLSQNGIKKFSFSEESGQLIGIMGGSGSGKSTLLNVLNGKLPPKSGEILINSYNIHKNPGKVAGLIGYVPQDDLLIEDLTVFQNLYYSARLSFGNLSDEDINQIVEKVLIDLGLEETRDLKVGNPLNKFISGGQRKRLNIGLELMREPAVLFIDEPTSGLSSMDTKIVMNLLKDQALKGKLVIANIHQPSSDIFKLFDKLWVIDKGGYPVYTGNPIDALVYFKTVSGHVNPSQTECACCGNVNAEQLLEIIEAREVDESGKYSQRRKYSPERWYKLYQENIESGTKERKFQKSLPKKLFTRPDLFAQFKIFSIRNAKAKLSNRQYLIVSLLEAPLLALLLALFTKHTINDVYIFGENVNLPAYLFMSVVVALFLGLTISAEEIINDRRILERESFLSLSWFSYLNSKIVWLFTLSAIQTISFIVIGNHILEIKGMVPAYWIILFSASCYANMLGMNISSAFNSVVTIYIIVPFLLVPQLILSGTIVKFDDLHKSFTNKIYVPMAGDLMASRWAYEALAVEQFKNNRFEKLFFEDEQQFSVASFRASFLIPRLQTKLDLIDRGGLVINNPDEAATNLSIVRNELLQLQEAADRMPFEYLGRLVPEMLTPEIIEETNAYLIYLRLIFADQAREASTRKDEVYRELENRLGSNELYRFRQQHYNKSLADLVLNRHEVNTIFKTENRLIQKKDPIFLVSDSPYGRSHFYAPAKKLYRFYIDTLWFNVLAIWLMIGILYLSLLLDLPRRFVSYLESLSFKLQERPLRLGF